MFVNYRYNKYKIILVVIIVAQLIQNLQFFIFEASVADICMCDVLLFRSRGIQRFIFQCIPLFVWDYYEYERMQRPVYMIRYVDIKYINKKMWYKHIFMFMIITIFDFLDSYVLALLNNLPLINWNSAKSKFFLEYMTTVEDSAWMVITRWLFMQFFFSIVFWLMECIYFMLSKGKLPILFLLCMIIILMIDRIPIYYLLLFQSTNLARAVINDGYYWKAGIFFLVCLGGYMFVKKCNEKK